MQSLAQPLSIAQCREIERTVRTLKREGSYDSYLSAEADKQAAAVGLLLGYLFELSDRDVERIVASLPPFPKPGLEQVQVDIERLLRRLRGEDDDGLAGAPARR